MVGLLGRHGIEAVDLGATRANLRHEAKQRAMVERMAGLGGFLITGGNQRRLVEALLYRGEESAVLHALTLAWQRGATIIAASGGAAALSPLMIAGGSSREALRFGVAPDATHPGLLIEPGLGLFGAGLLDQNMVGAQRLGRLIVACAEEAVPLGFGLCEEGGLVVEADRRMRVIGRRGVILVEVDPQRLTFEDDLFTLRGVKLSMVPPQDWIGPAGPVVAPRRVGDGVGPSLAELLAALEHEAAFGRSRQGRVRIRTRALAAHAAELDIEACRTD